MSPETNSETQKKREKVFISYSRKDIRFARRLAGDLEKAGFDVWWDISDLKGGDDWVRLIPTAIAESKHFIVLLSPDSIKSEWVSKEYTYAIANRKRIVPAMIKPCAVPFALNTLNYVNFTTDDYATGLNNLLVALGSSPLPPPRTWWGRFFQKLPPQIARYFNFIIAALVIALAIFLYLKIKPAPDIPLTQTPPTPTYTATASLTYTPTVSLTPTNTRTRTPIPINFVPPSVCVQPEFDVHSVNVRSGPGTDKGVLVDAPAIVVGKCPLIGGRNEEDTWLMIAHDQPDPELQPFEGGWIRKDLFDPDMLARVFLPPITLTPTPTITPTYTITLTFTPTSTFTKTPTPTFTKTPTYTPTATNTPTQTLTPTPEPTNTP